jgi:hypothetical protein
MICTQACSARLLHTPPGGRLTVSQHRHTIDFSESPFQGWTQAFCAAALFDRREYG